MALLDKLKLDEQNQKILRTNRQTQQVGGFSLFKNVVFGQMRQIIKANFLAIAFCLPAIVWVWWSSFQMSTLTAALSYSASIGFGYPVNADLFIISQTQRFLRSFNSALILMPLIAIAFAGLAGMFNVVKYLCWGMEVKIIKTFFKGVKNGYAAFIWMGTIIAIIYLLFTLAISGFDVWGVPIWLKVLSIILLSFIALYTLILSVFVFSQAQMFNLSVMTMLKNAFILSTKFVLQNIFIAIVGIIGFFILLIPFPTGNTIFSLVQIFSMAIVFMLALGFLSTAWTIYSQFIFDAVFDPDKKINVDIDSGSTSGKKTHNTNHDTVAAKKQKTTYQNPKKKKKG